MVQALKKNNSRIKQRLKKLQATREKRPLLSMILFYSVIWIVLCLGLTRGSAGRYMENATRDWGSRWSSLFQNLLRDFEREASQPGFRYELQREYIARQLESIEVRLGARYYYSERLEEPYGLFQAKKKNDVEVVNLQSYQTERMCQLLSRSELLQKGADQYGDKFSEIYLASEIYYLDRFENPNNNDVDDRVYFSVDLLKSKRGKTGRLFPILQGDIIVNYYNVIRNPNTGEILLLRVNCILPGELAAEGKVFLYRMAWFCFFTFLFFAFIIWHNYKRVHSARVKSVFYKSLVNSMAHDLKSPLMVMQGYCENLKENVHTEKKDYYADQVLGNIQYLSTLMDRNLYHTRKREGMAEETAPGTPPIYLSELVNAAIERNQDRLQEKNIHVMLSGETALMGDKETLSLVVENIIGNAAKYTLENGTIEITGTEYAFFVSNTAELSYGKNLQQLLNPLEMGDESRTAGSGTGLGLAIANGIIQGYGGKIKLSYDKKRKRFTCFVKLGRARWTRNADVV